MRLDKKSSIVVLTGAGISAESGLPTFRASDGLWENHRIEDICTPEAFERNPALVQDFYNKRRAALTTVEPNAAHLALAELEQKWQGEFLLVTQNVDNLHERAGSQKLLHMHGELTKARCLSTGRVEECTGDLDANSNLRPHIVWFYEMPLFMEEIEAALMNADLFIAIGTSGKVYPAAGFVQQARYFGARTLEINLEASDVSGEFMEARTGTAGKEVPKLVEELLRGL